MLSRTNTCNGFLEDSDSSEFMYTSDNSIINTNNNSNNSNNNSNNNNNDDNDNNDNDKEESIGSELSDELLNETLLKKHNDQIVKTNSYIYSLVCIICITLIISITLFAIYKLTNSKKYLYNYSLIGFFTTLCLTCCLGSCIKYRTEMETKNME